MSRRSLSTWLVTLLAAAATELVKPAFGQITNASAVTAQVRPLQAAVPAGQPLWVDFLLHNPTGEVAVLFPQNMLSLELNSPEMGLPLIHLLGGSAAPALTITSDGADVSCPPAQHQDAQAIAVRLAPGAMVGLRVDLAELCPSMRRPGVYKLQWRPYEGRLSAEPVTLSVLALKQVLIRTDYGEMQVRLYYEDAPRHVQNFLELIGQGFYDGLTFHRLIPGFLIQGGAPAEDPSALRPDGQRLEPEFNNHPFTRGTLGMARWPGDPASASCQFFITGQRLPELDGAYTAYGEIVGEESFKTLDALMEQTVGSNNNPVRKIYIREIRAQDEVLPRASGSFVSP